MNIDTIIAQALAEYHGTWTFTGTSGHWYSVRHAGTDKLIDIRKVGMMGAFIVRTDDGVFHWTGHDLHKGLREADDYLTQHNRTR